MSDEIKVFVNEYGKGRNLVMLYFDPISGKRIPKSTGTRDPREAERCAAIWQAELNAGGGQSPSKITWMDFRERYENEHLATLAPRSRLTYAVVLDSVERILAPDRLCKMTSAVISKYAAELRKPHSVCLRGGKKKVIPGLKDSSVALHLRHLKSALSWGAKMGLLVKRPDIVTPKRKKGSLAKARPVTGEEFDRMISAVPEALARKVWNKETKQWEMIPPAAETTEAWQGYLRGLWLSGLRLEESMILSWEPDSPFYIELTGRRPVFVIRAEGQKSRRDEILPMTPDFAEWMQSAFPETERQGRVFKLGVLSNQVSKIVSNIGEKARVVVNREGGKFASAHDLRRAFGTRWAKKVMPAVLRRLMRHADIQTTMAYYVDLDAAEIADALWESHSNENQPGYNNHYNTQPSEHQTHNLETTQVLENQGLAE